MRVIRIARQLAFTVMIGLVLGLGTVPSRATLGWCDDFWENCAIQCGGWEEICFGEEPGWPPPCPGDPSFCDDVLEYGECYCRY